MNDMPVKRHLCLGWGLALLLSFNARGQPPTPDSSLLVARQAAIAVYQVSVGLESQLYNGTEYVNYDRHYITGHQFFGQDQEGLSEICYDGVRHSQVLLRYDIHRDQLVLRHPTSALQFRLVNDKVASFTLGADTFIRLEKDSLAAGAGKTGFYQVLTSGKVRVLARRHKDLQESATREGLQGEFRVVDRFFIFRDNALIPVKTKGDVYKALPGRRKELQQYAGAQKLQFGKTREASLVALIRFYNELPVN
jgi:hypothetical protein